MPSGDDMSRRTPGPSRSVHAELIEVGRATPRTLAAWRDLAARAAEPNPWAEPELLLPLGRHLIPGLMLVVAERAGEMVACLPLKPNTGRGLGSMPIGWGVPHPVGTPLLDSAALEPALWAILDVLRRLPHLHVSWRGIGADGPTWPVLSPILAAAAPRRLRQVQGTWPVWRRSSKASGLEGTAIEPRRLELAAGRRRLEEELGHPLELRDRSGEDAAADAFMAVELASTTGRLGRATLQHPGAATYFREVCRGFRAVGRLRVLALEGGVTTVAMKCEVGGGAGLFEMKAAEDERFGAHAPRALLEVEAARTLPRGLEWAVSTALDEGSPLHWLWTDRRPWTDVYFWLAGPAGSAWRMVATVARHLVPGAIGRLGVPTGPAGPGPRSAKLARRSGSESP